MTDVKVSLNILVPGAVMYSKQECFKNPETESNPIEGKTTQHSMLIAGDPKPGQRKPELTRISFHTRNSEPARQHINLTREAYDYMINGEFCPEWFRSPESRNNSNYWKNVLDEKARIKLHLERLAESLGGTLESFEILED